MDADGTVRLGKTTKNPEHTRYPVVEFWNCDVSILKQIQNRWGGNIVSLTTDNPNRNNSYMLTLTYNKAYNLLREVVPYMKHEKKCYRANLIVNHYKELTPRNGKYTKSQMKDKLKLVEQIMNVTMRGSGAY